MYIFFWYFNVILGADRWGGDGPGCSVPHPGRRPEEGEIRRSEHGDPNQHRAGAYAFQSALHAWRPGKNELSADNFIFFHTLFTLCLGYIIFNKSELKAIYSVQFPFFLVIYKTLLKKTRMIIKLGLIFYSPWARTKRSLAHFVSRLSKGEDSLLLKQEEQEVEKKSHLNYYC